jgi:hypothetical protein
MLTALEQGVKGGVWFSLSDKVSAERNLRAAATSVAANHGAPGVDHVTVEAFLGDLDTNLAKLTAALRDGSYEPQAIRRVYIPKPGSKEQRPLGVPMTRAYCTPYQEPWGWSPCRWPGATAVGCSQGGSRGCRPPASLATLTSTTGPASAAAPASATGR